VEQLLDGGEDGFRRRGLGEMGDVGASGSGVTSPEIGGIFYDGDHRVVLSICNRLKVSKPPPGIVMSGTDQVRRTWRTII
jgi:hypothetical protein